MRRAWAVLLLCLPLMAQKHPIGLGNTGTVSGNSVCMNGDTGITRSAAGTLNFGSCTVGDQTGTVNLTILNTVGVSSGSLTLRGSVSGSVVATTPSTGGEFDLNNPLGLQGATSGTALLTAPAIAGTLSNPVLSSNALQIGAAGGAGGILLLGGSTSGTASLTAPAIAGTTTNALISSNVLSAPVGTVANVGYGFSAATHPGTGMYDFSGGALGLAVLGTQIAFANGTAFSVKAFGTITNCAGVGTAASPSVATCAAAPAGHFSCATNATGATCQVNTTAVTASSEIFVFESDAAATGTALGVTCNTSTTVNPATRLLASYVAGASFTINLGTVTTNPACFSYFIVN